MKRIIGVILIVSIMLMGLTVFAEKINIYEKKEMKFIDISGHWAEEAINKIIDKGSFPIDRGEFLPDRAITRSEFVLMLHKALNINIAYFKAPDIGEFYDDVKNEDVYASALYDLVIADIIDCKGQFKPESTLSREEMVHFIMNAYRYKMGENYRMIKLAEKPFSDDMDINPSFNGSIMRAENMGITIRPVSNLFNPKNAGTRAQSATVIFRLLNLLEKETSNVTVTVTPSLEFKEDLLVMKLTIVNNLKTRVIINHSSGQKYDFSLLDSNKNILYTWSADKLFIMAEEETVLEPGESIEFIGEVEKDVIKDISEKTVYLKAQIVGRSEEFTINPDGYTIELQK